MISRVVLEEREKLDAAYIKSWWISALIWIIPVFVFILTKDVMITGVLLWGAVGYDNYHKRKHCGLMLDAELEAI